MIITNKTNKFEHSSGHYKPRSQPLVVEFQPSTIINHYCHHNQRSFWTIEQAQSSSLSFNQHDRNQSVLTFLIYCTSSWPFSNRPPIQHQSPTNQPSTDHQSNHQSAILHHLFPATEHWRGLVGSWVGAAGASGDGWVPHCKVTTVTSKK